MSDAPRHVPSRAGRAVFALAVALGMLGAAGEAFAGPESRLLRRPAVSGTDVAFAYASDLWIVPRSGGAARRLTATPDVETDPHFSPDGSRIAFTATVGGNTDVYVVSTEGGTPRRLTYHPGLDLIRGWTSDGRRVVFASARGALPTPRVSSYVRLWTLGLEDGLPDLLPMPRAYTGAFSPDGKRFAYEEFSTEFETLEGQRQSAQWRHYRGGRTHPIRVMNLGDYTEETLPWRDSNDSDPMWVGKTIYFVSDRDFTANIFAFHTDSGELEQVTHHDGYDVMNASSGDGAIVYEQAGYIHLIDTRNGDAHRLHVEVDGDFPWARPRMENVAEMIRHAALSPHGDRVAFEARGEIFVQPPEARGAGGENGALNLTLTPGAHERDAAWSEDGSRLAWLSDASGEYQLMVTGPELAASPRAIDLPLHGFFSGPVWSPDGRYLLLRDNHLTLWMIEIASGRATRIDADIYGDPERCIVPVWSVDSRWIAYSRNSTNHLRAIFLYSVDRGKAYQVTDSDVDAVSPAFDRGGDYLYFLASTDYAQNVEWVGMNALERPVTRTIHALVLQENGVSPLAPPTGRAAADPRGSGIDVEGLEERIVTFDVAPRDYADLVAGSPRTFLYTEYETSGLQRLLSPKSVSLLRYRLATRETEVLRKGIGAYSISADGDKLLYRKSDGSEWALADLARPVRARDLEVGTGGLTMRIEPHAEWAHIFLEAWRNQRDYFYQPTMHGADWQAIYDKYVPLVPHVNHRADLGYLLATVGGELTVGHSSLTGPGDVPRDEPVTIGMLGADYDIDRGRYRIRRIYAGDSWDPARQGPLAVPGLGVEEGEYLLEVNGKSVIPPANIYAVFKGTANQPTELRVGPTPRLSDSRVVTVAPVRDEEPLRTYDDWIEKNRRLVGKLSGGRVGYVWLTNTGPHGYRAFNREYYAQLDKEGVVIDVRYNQGGFISDYIVDTLTRPLRDYLVGRDGAVSPSPIGAIHGPKVMVINESSGSGGDALPYHFKLAKAGLLVGTRTWGGLVGVSAPPPETLDGGGITAPDATWYDLQGRWLVENKGVSPDIRVENTPAAVIAGHDPQLERAVQEVLNLLKNNPRPQVPKPAPPDRVHRHAKQ